MNKSDLIDGMLSLAQAITSDEPNLRAAKGVLLMLAASVRIEMTVDFFREIEPLFQAQLATKIANRFGKWD